MISVEEVKQDIINLAAKKGKTVDRFRECPMILGSDDIKSRASVIQAFEKTTEGHTHNVFYLGYVGDEVALNVRHSYAKELFRFTKENNSELHGGTLERASFTTDGLKIEIDYWGSRHTLLPLYDYSWVLRGT